MGTAVFIPATIGARTGGEPRLVGDADDDAALAWVLAVAVLQRRDSAIAQVD